ncbi:MAG TPA: two-component regulator propeller domain-containing protein [Candidatus Solibacter sp.]|nr:two-component regulator propeller domain-containing protein [Candidatus Solibacter sp.]
MLRFDGVRKVGWEELTSEQLPNNNVRTLLAAREGTLWIGTAKGLASWKNGKLTQYKELKEQRIQRLFEDHEGSIWAGGFAVPTGRLCVIQKGKVQCHGEDGRFGQGVFSFYETRDSFWAGAMTGLWRWKPDPPKLYRTPDLKDNASDLIQGDNGRLWIATQKGIRELVDGKAEAYPLPVDREIIPYRWIRDRDGGLWIGTTGQGLLHVHQGRADIFASVDGLSGDSVATVFEDSEGSIWIATDGGLDRFHDFPVSTISIGQGRPSPACWSVLDDARDGSIWLGTANGLYRWNHQQITIYRKRRSLSPARSARKVEAHEIYDEGLPDNYVESLFQDERGRIWVTTVRGIAYFEDGRFHPILSIPAAVAPALVEESSGSLWISDQNLGLLRLVNGRVVEQIPWAKIGRQVALTLAVDPALGGLWLGYFQGGLAYFKDGQVRASYAAADGLGDGSVNSLRFDRDGALWAATEGGLSRLKNGRILTLSSKHGLPCNAVQWSMEDDAGSIWLYSPCGLVRVARSELDAWAADPRRTIKTTVLDSSDGVTNYAAVFSPRVAKSRDGKMWFQSPYGVSILDPRRIHLNKRPPPVHVEAVKINGKETTPADGLQLAYRNNDLEIDYTALSLVIPERVLFRIKLEGKDSDWEDAGTRRQAYYNNLPPRKYRFRVMACNNDGVWNETGAAWSFTIVPAYYQTLWFQALCVIAAGALTWMLYHLRLRTMSARINLLYNERLAERTRIARDLHDTLLQSLAGVSLQLHGIAKTAATAPEKTPSQVDKIRQQVDATFREARSKVYNLRSPALEGQGLTEALSDFVERLGPTATARCTLHVTGEPVPCTPEIEEELLRIAQEAANNANRHAGAKEIRIALEYSGRSLKLSICDDGCGFQLDEGLAKTGHWGLKNMPERAAQIRGKCTITSSPGHGTRIEVHVPLRRWSLRKNLAKRANSSSGD